METSSVAGVKVKCFPATSFLSKKLKINAPTNLLKKQNQLLYSEQSNASHRSGRDTPSSLTVCQLHE